jgi:hypothetical protein
MAGRAESRQRLALLILRVLLWPGERVGGEHLALSAFAQIDEMSAELPKTLT